MVCRSKGRGRRGVGRAQTILPPARSVPVPRRRESRRRPPACPPFLDRLLASILPLDEPVTTVATFGTPAEAELARNRLARNGLAAVAEYAETAGMLFD